MKKIAVAMNNQILVDQIKRTGKYIVNDYDIDTKEMAIEYVSKHHPDILITKDDLMGELNKEEYINEIRRKNREIKIVLCVSELTETYRAFLLMNNVLNIIESDEIKFGEILDMIESKDVVILKNNNIIQKEEVEEDKINVVTKQKICVYGTSGAGKSYVASVLAQITSKKLKLNTLLVDMDLQNAATDIYNNLTNSGNSLEYVMEEIDRGSFNIDTLNEIIAKEKKKNGKLSFITNNMGIYECQNKISKEYYEKLYDETQSKYDVVILDMPNAPFLDVVPYSVSKSDKVFFVINPNYISIRQAIKYLDLITNIWKVDKDNIYIVVNRIKEESLEMRQIAALLKDYRICMKIAEDSKVEGIINGIAELNYNSLDKEEDLKELISAFGTI